MERPFLKRLGLSIVTILLALLPAHLLASAAYAPIVTGGNRYDNNGNLIEAQSKAS